MLRQLSVSMKRATAQAGSRVAGSRVAYRLRAFQKDEDGALIFFALMLFCLMFMMGGLAIDLLRYEQTRTTLQNTLDRATLAAADLTQDLNSEDVVYDYFMKAGVSEYLDMVEVSEGINFREVQAVASAQTYSIFSMGGPQNTLDTKMVLTNNTGQGIKGASAEPKSHMFSLWGDGLMAAAGSTAEQRVTNVEISLVLDVSGSMNTNSRLQNLKTAAIEFVDTVLSSDAENRISISLVPFNGQVNLGPNLRARYNATVPNGQTNVDCVDLPASAYTVPGIATTLALPMTAYADTYSTTQTPTSFYSYSDTTWSTPATGNMWCPPIANNIVRLPSNNITQLSNQINGLTAIGATSINAGMKWGVTLIDPGTRPVFDQMRSLGQIPATWAGRPYEYDDDEALKIVVLMTDGEHFAEERVNTAYKSGLSNVYRSTGDGNYSIEHTSGRPSGAGTNRFWTPHRNEWRAAAWNSGSGVVQQTWPQLWSRQRISWVAWQLHARALGTTSSTRTNAYNNAMTLYKSQTPTSTMDAQLSSICQMAKVRNVTVYGIAFEAPSNGQAAISNCASSAAHYFNASGLQIRTAFRAIASNISQLRLTQ